MSDILSNFYRHVKVYFDKFNTSIVPTIQNNITISPSKYKHTNVIPYSISYLSPKLQDCINEHSYWLRRYSFLQLQPHVYVNIYSTSHQYNQDNNILFVIFFAIFYCSCIKGIIESNEINIDVILSKYNKILSKDGLLNEYNVNSGVTSYRIHSKSVNILVYRKEEVAKVLIHEIIHAMRLDYGHTQFNGNVVSAYFGANTQLNTNESFTETFACLLNCALSSLIQNAGVKSFKQSVHNEIDFSKHQANKVLTTLGFLCDDKGKITPMRGYEESTNIISYYVLKCVNLTNINWFLVFLERNNYRLTDISKYNNYLQKQLSKFKWLFHETNSARGTSTLRMSSIELLDILGGNKKAYKTFCR
jgi:hypothetical protein